MGPVRPFPSTRRAPVAAFELFVGTAPVIDDFGAEVSRAYLAHVQVVPPFTSAQRSTWWDKSKEIRRTSLKLADGEDDHRAKAKVALVVPLKLAKSLGCAP
jgi:hypothetical protein